MLILRVKTMKMKALDYRRTVVNLSVVVLMVWSFRRSRHCQLRRLDQRKREKFDHVLFSASPSNGLTSPLSLSSIDPLSSHQLCHQHRDFSLIWNPPIPLLKWNTSRTP
ncbi:hypothetical protein CPB83DRAFT_860642 [Crepidotus variabilis]|uniref:Uncharacterized protein n=1 Tax=Crepidotus variabilis TaxID=179855 RepID=A0A9P6E985_9AGAR|nr:hypothetical protein CPB83DRAFT_860642 [Crepidotus variabilis]